MDKNRDKWNNYVVGKANFINANRDCLFHKMWIDYMQAHPELESVLEIGPGEMVEYPEVRKLRKLNYTVLEISNPFRENIISAYPEILIRTPLPIEDPFHYCCGDYDVVRVCDVLEHTYPVHDAIKNIVTSALRFHITMFKWATGGENLGSSLRKDSNGSMYYSTIFPIRMIMAEIKKYGELQEAVVVIEETGEIIQFEDYWLEHEFNINAPQKSMRGNRIVMTGARYARS